MFMHIWYFLTLTLSSERELHCRIEKPARRDGAQREKD